jgi:hypothetical protein
MESAPSPPRSRSHTTPATLTQQPTTAAQSTRSAVTNGNRLFVERPGDTAWARRFKDVLFLIVNDLGGADILSEGQKQLARRAATLCITCERMEGKAASGEDINLEQYGRITDRLGRTFRRLGLKRQARDVTPTLGQLIRADQDAERHRLASKRKHEEPE